MKRIEKLMKFLVFIGFSALDHAAGSGVSAKPVHKREQN